MDLSNVALPQVMDFITKVGLYLFVPAGSVFIVLNFFGKRVFRSLTEDIVGDKMSDMLENHTLKCRNQSLEFNDGRYLLAKEFQIYMKSQIETNARLEKTSDEVRQLCSLILVSLNKKGD